MCSSDLSLLIATALIVAIRTAKWAAVGRKYDDGCSDVDPDLEREVRFAARVSMWVMNELLDQHEDMFPQKKVPVWEPTDEDVPK